MEIYKYKGIKWTAKQIGNFVELHPFGVNGGCIVKFGKYIFTELLANKEIVICKK